MRRTWPMLALPLFALVPVSADAETASPLGTEFQVNGYTTGAQYDAAIAADATGNFVVLWVSEGSPEDDNLSTSIVGQRFRSDGSMSGAAFQANTYTSGGQFRPDVAMDSSGAFVVAWDDPGAGTDVDNGAIHMRAFASDGSALGAQMQVNAWTTETQRRPSVALADSGRFVVAWDSYGSSGTDSASASVQVQRFSPTRAPEGNETQVNTYTTGFQKDADVAMEADGDFVVVWGSSQATEDTSSYSVQGQRFGSDGAALGDQFRVNAYTTYSQDLPHIAMDALGGFVVAWQGVGSSSADDEIQMRRFSSDGVAVGNEVQVNTYATNSQYEPTISMSTTGDFVVGWYGYGSDDTDNDESSAHARVYSPAGIPIGSEFQANTHTTSYQYVTRVAMDGEGDFVIVWHSDGPAASDNDSYGIRGRRFGEAPIFSDGFETGNTLEWPRTVPAPTG